MKYIELFEERGSGSHRYGSNWYSFVLQNREDRDKFIAHYFRDYYEVSVPLKDNRTGENTGEYRIDVKNRNMFRKGLNYAKKYGFRITKVHEPGDETFKEYTGNLPEEELNRIRQSYRGRENTQQFGI